jgi:hypothetical protein
VAYSPSLIDDFNDGTIDPAKWAIIQGPGATESGGTLNLPCNMNYPRVEGQILHDLSNGIFAAKLSATGTRVEASEFYIGAHDGAGNHISAMGGANGAYLTFQPGGLATSSNVVVTDTTVGIGWDWTPGNWWGIGNMGTDNIVRMYNSADGQTWNEMARCTVGGTFNKFQTGLVCMAGIWNGTLTDLTAKFDDATFWVSETGGDSYHPVKIRSGGGWVTAMPKVRVDGAWISTHPKPRVGGTWIAS